MITNFGTSSLNKLLQLVKSKFDSLDDIATTGSFNNLKDVPTFATEKYVNDSINGMSIFVKNTTVE